MDFYRHTGRVWIAKLSIKDMRTFTGDDTVNSAVLEGLKISLKDIFN